MVYIKKFFLPSERAELGFIQNEKRSCFYTFYPFKIFPEKHLREVEFDGITMLYGTNGSGKSTLLNVLASKMRAVRYSEFNHAPLFNPFVEMCSLEYARAPEKVYALTSDDVFEYTLNARSVNETISARRNELFEKYVAVHHEMVRNPEIGKLRGLDDYERWSETREILSAARSQSDYIKKRVARDVELYSNGETAMRYFIDRIEEDAVYLLDEPENSLSISFQIELAEYIAATARATRSQFIIATHSPILLSMKGAKIYNLDDDPAEPCEWTELPNVRRYFDFFMKHREDFL